MSKKINHVRSKKDLNRKLDEETEKIEVMGQESETKAVKWVQEVQKEEDKKLDDAQATAREILENSRKKRFIYHEALLKELQRQQRDNPIPPNFIWGATMNEQGIILWFKDPDGNAAQVAMKPSGEPLYDLNWIERRVHDTLVIMDKIEKNRETPANGIILPRGYDRRNTQRPN